MLANGFTVLHGALAMARNLMFFLLVTSFAQAMGCEPPPVGGAPEDQLEYSNAPVEHAPRRQALEAAPDDAAILALQAEGGFVGVDEHGNTLRFESSPILIATENGVPPAPEQTEQERWANRVDSSRALLLAQLETLGDEPFVEVVAVLPEPAGKESVDYSSAEGISRRKAALDTYLEPFAQSLEAEGVKVLHRYWLFPGLHLHIPRATLTTVLERHPGIEFTPSATAIAGEMDGMQYQDALLSEAFIQQNYDGSAGSRFFSGFPYPSIGWKQKLAFLEEAPLNCEHVGFAEGRDGPLRIIGKSCNSTAYPATGCYTYLEEPTLPEACHDQEWLETHATKVAWVAAGSIRGGEDWSIYLPEMRRQRSGIASRARFFQYRLQSPLYPSPTAHNCSVTLAIEDAVENGVDVLNFSGRLVFSSDPEEYSATELSLWCGKYNNVCGLSSAIDAAWDAGMLFVKSSGNAHDEEPSMCNVTLPGEHPRVLTVGGLDDPSWSNPPDPRYWVRRSELSESSSRGRVAHTLQGGAHTFVDLVGLVAPGQIVSFFSDTSTRGYATYSVRTGTSYAAPGVAGVAVLLRHYLNANYPSFGANTTGRLLANLLVMGDGYTGGHYSTSHLTSISANSGFGRLRAHFPSSNNLTAPWGWGSHSFMLYHGQTVAFDVGGPGPESSLISNWKWAVVMDWPYGYVETPNIDIRVVNTCQPPVTYDEVGDMTEVFRHRIRLYSSQIAGRCLQMRVTGVNVPSQGVRIYMADYYHSGDPELH
jgi:hypothetical protein